MEGGGGGEPPHGSRLKALLAKREAAKKAAAEEGGGDSGAPAPLEAAPSIGPPAGRAALLATIRAGRAPSTAAGSVGPPSGRAALLATLKVKSASEAGPGQAEVRAAMLERLKAKSVQQSVGMRRSGTSGTSAPSSSPPGGSPPPSAAGEPPPQLEEVEVGAEARVTRMTGGLESLRLGEGADQPPVVRRGEGGAPIKLSANYIRLELAEDRGMWEYEVRFSPPVDSVDERHKLMRQHREVLGPTKTFDGICLYLPERLAEDVTCLEAEHSIDQAIVKLTITLKHRKKLADRSSIQFYNTLFRRIMNTLKMVQMNKNYYNPAEAMMVPQHKLEIWPGYVTAVHEYEGGVMLCLDVSHKVLRTSTAADLLKDVYRKDSTNMVANSKKALLGAVVLTRYNNKCYRVDDVDFDQNCLTTFPYHNGEDKTFFDYYQQQYGITIKDPKQPLLISRSKRKTAEESEVASLVALVPELCNMTGLTDTMKADFKVMKDVAMFTRITPAQRQVAMQKFLDNVANSAEASAHLLNWGLVLGKATVKLEGRRFPQEKLHAGKKFQFKVSDKADWTREVTTNTCLYGEPLKKWLVVYVGKNGEVVKNFVQLMMKLAPKMGIPVAQPAMAELPNDRTETFVSVIRDKVEPSIQLVCAIMPTPRDDRYAAVKKLCCVEKPVASQVINFKTISNEKKVSSVVQKVALQINCKLGGELWGCDIPMKHLMVVGVDVFHDHSRSTPSIAGIVSSTNPAMSKWYSSTCFQAAGQELVDTVKPAFVRAIKEYYRAQHAWPEKILVFRDGVGDTQLSTVARYEAEQFRSTFRLVSEDYSPSFGFIVVQKRINTRIFARGSKAPENPPPGTVLDHTVTKRDWYDFFLVSQHVGQGTVSPTHYIVVHDNTGLKPDIIQKISYKLTHMYYNWPGTVRVPAPCQYAHKLAYQVGEHIHKEPSEQLSSRLFYL